MEGVPPGSFLRAVFQPPRRGMTGASYLELRFLTVTGFVLTVLGIVAMVAFPLLLGFSPIDFAINSTSTLVLAIAFGLALRGKRRASANVLLTVLVFAVWVATLRQGGSTLHDLFVLTALLPVILAFSLRRFVVGLGVATVTTAYALYHAVLAPALDANMLSAALLLVSGTALAGIAPFLRIKEAKRAEDAERESRALLGRLREAQEIAHLGSWEYEPSAGRMVWSDEMYGIFGRDKATFTPVYEKAFEMVPADERDRVREGFEQALARGDSSHAVEHRIVWPDGTVRHVSERVRFVRDAQGSPLRAVGTAQDVTDRVQAEQARAALQQQEQEVARLQHVARLRADFLNAAAHDLKTPLTPLKLQMATMRLKRDAMTPEQRASLDLLDRNIARFAALVEDLLESARLQAGRLRLRRQPTSLAELVRDAAATFEEQAREGGVRLDVGDLPAVRIDVDPAKCMQVLMNLVSNGLRYTPAGGQVTLDAQVADDMAEVRIRDTGLGLSAEQLGQMFQPFARLHEDKLATATGTGLGLYISKGIVEQHGGRIWVESAGPGEGALFHVTWPLAKEPATPAG